jgi:hypothetical protein
VPWTGGVNTSVDAGILPPNDLVQADNVVFAASGSRLKREGFDFFDTALPAVTFRSSSGTTRTLVFASTISDTSAPVDHLIVVGEKLTIAASTNTNYNSTACIVATLTTTTITNDTITYTFAGAASLSEASTAASSITVARNYDIIACFDHWYFVSSNNAKSQALIGITSQGLMFRYDSNGQRKLIPASGAGATALAVTTLTSADLRTYNNRLIWTMSGVGNTPKYVDFATADEWKDLAANAPDASIMQEHQGRLWMNDKTNLDRLHYCETFDETLWLGVGDSGALDVAQGDGDEQGLTAIYPTFKGRLILAKGSRTFQMTGEAPEEYFIESMTNGLGAVSHKSVVAVDLDDVYYFSQRGAHSIKATDQYGDFAGGYLTKDIQPTYNLWSNSQRKFSQGAFISTLNSVAWTVAENGQTKPNALWLFNPYVKNAPEDAGVWFRWPDLYPQSVCMQVYSSKPRIVIGNNAGRILRGQNAQYTDRSTAGITFRAKTGTVYVDNSPQSIKAFKKFGLLFRPRGRFSFTVYFKVDAQPVQTILFEQSQTGAVLGTTFTLGASILGNSAIMAPYMKDVVGHGRGCTIEVFQTGSEAQIEVYGFLIEYEPADIADEVVQDG